MSSTLVCPDCKRTLRVPETELGKKFRCPICNALLPAVPEPDTSSPALAVKTAPSPRTAVPSRGRRPRDEEPEDERQPTTTEPPGKKSSRRDHSLRKNSLTGLIIGLVAGGVALPLGLGIGGGLFWHFFRNKTIPQSEWQVFSPPNSGCTVLMPGTPVSQTLNTLGVRTTQYEVKRKKEDAYFAVSIFNVPPESLRPNLLEDVAKSSRDGALARAGGSTVTSETSISLGNLPGREYQLKLPPRGTFIARVYLAKIGNTHRVYLVMAGGSNIQPNQGDAARFFDSFKIDASATPPTLTGAAGEGAAQPPLAQPPANPQPNVPPGIPGPRFPRRPRP